MKKDEGETYPQEETETKNKREKPAANTLQIISAGFHNLLSIYWPNFIIGIIILLIGIPIVMGLSSSKKNAIYALAIGLWILAGLVLFGLARFAIRKVEDHHVQPPNQIAQTEPNTIPDPQNLKEQPPKITEPT